MLTTYREMQNLLGMVSMSLIFMEPKATISDPEMANHNHLYSGFTYSQSASAATFPFLGISGAYYDDDEE